MIIVLIIIVATLFGYFYMYQPQAKTGENVEGTNFFADFLPFGKSKTTTNTNTETPADISGFVPEENQTKDSNLNKISSFPIAGYGIFMKEKNAGEYAPALRYVNKANGNIYQTFAHEIDERKFSSTIIPKVHEAFFGNKGESVVMRYLKTDGKTIETFVGALEKEYFGADSIGTNDVKGSFLPENISDISVSPDLSKIFYLFESNDSVIGVSYSLQTNSKTQIFDSPFTEWLSFWPNSKMITVTTKPSYNVPGYSYIINPERKDFNKIVGEIKGLTTLASPNGKSMLYSDNNLSLSILDIENKNTNSIGIKTLPEKCIWTKTSDTIYCAVPKYLEQSQYPDSWYQGEISFSDQIWKVDVATGNTTLLLDPITSTNGEEVDAIKLGLDENEDYLFFVNKKDSYLWELKLK